ncbi:MAG: hypothetical protein O7G85_00235 [Planctomycetota bacterium]|nr:hypothetical protein [Planctomycetota bacterium]
MFLIMGLVIGVIGILVASWRWSGFRSDGAIPFLSASEDDGVWIRHHEPYNLNARRPGVVQHGFRQRFNLDMPLIGSTLKVHSFKACIVILDGQQIHQSPQDFEQWRNVERVTLPSPLAAGPHELMILVVNESAPPLIMVSSEKLTLPSDGWETTKDGEQWSEAISIRDVESPSLSGKFPSTIKAIEQASPIIMLFLLLGGVITGLEARRTLLDPDAKPLLSSSGLRWILIGLWIVLGVNNAIKIPSIIGFDASSHLEYIKFIVEQRSLPLATDGWQMFQSPLNYLISAPIYALCSGLMNDESIVKVLRIVPLLCGIGQLEIAYRCGRLVFAQRPDLQVITTLVGGLLPVSLYMSQSVGNEPMAGFFTALTILLCLHLLMRETIERPFLLYGMTGVVWGLALLSKVTPVLLVGPIFLVLVHGLSRSATNQKRTIGASLTLVGTTFLVSGWYFLRNWIELGRPFVGGWDQSRNIDWWQDPGYRIASHLVTFGESLKQPMYAGVYGIWDSMYSTIWLDGFLSGISAYDYRPPWNDSLMISGALLAIIPMSFLAMSMVTMWLPRLRHVRSAMLFCWMCLVVYLMAVLDLYWRLPIYSTAKGSYLLGLLPCVALLVAGGVAPLTRAPVGRAIVTTLICTWGLIAYLAYFVVSAPQLPTGP